MVTRVRSWVAFPMSGVLKIPSFSQFRTAKTMQQDFQAGFSPIHQHADNILLFSKDSGNWTEQYQTESSTMPWMLKNMEGQITLNYVVICYTICYTNMTRNALAEKTCKGNFKHLDITGDSRKCPIDSRQTYAAQDLADISCQKRNSHPSPGGHDHLMSS